MTAYNPCMPNGCFSLNINLPRLFPGVVKALSKGSEYIDLSFVNSQEDLEQSITYRTPLEEIRRYLNEIIEECSEVDWDGYGAMPFDPNSFVVAATFINSLPNYIQRPEISVDPDGEVALEWYNSPTRMFSISFGNKGNLSYAGIFGINKTHGKEFFEDRIPPIMLENIKRVFSTEES